MCPGWFGGHTFSPLLHTSDPYFSVSVTHDFPLSPVGSSHSAALELGYRWKFTSDSCVLSIGRSCMASLSVTTFVLRVVTLSEYYYPFMLLTSVQPVQF